MTETSAPGQSPRVAPLPLPTGLPIGDANAYVLVGPPHVLVDCGPRTEPTWEALLAGLDALGIDPADIDAVVLTHAHANHCGLVERLSNCVASGTGADAAEKPRELTIFGHPEALGALTDWSVTWTARIGLVDRAARAANVPEMVATQIVDSLVSRHMLGETVNGGRLVPLADGELVTVAGTTWRALWTPGHSPDHLALYHKASGTLISGDTLIRHLPTALLVEARGADGRRPRTLGALLATWKRLSRLEVETVWPGHGPPIRAHRLLIARRLADLRARIERVRELARGGQTDIWTVILTLGADPERPELLGVSLGEAVAILDWLSQKGEITALTSDGVVSYKAIG